MSGRLPSLPLHVGFRRPQAGENMVHGHRPRRHRALALVYRRSIAGFPPTVITTSNSAPVRLSLYFSWRVWLVQTLTTVVRQATAHPVFRDQPSAPPTTHRYGSPVQASPAPGRESHVRPRRAVIRPPALEPEGSHGGARHHSEERSSQSPRGVPGPGQHARLFRGPSTWSVDGMPGGVPERGPLDPIALRVERHLPASRRDGPKPGSSGGAGRQGVTPRRAERVGHGRDRGGVGWPVGRRGASAQDEGRGAPVRGTLRYRVGAAELRGHADSIRSGPPGAARPRRVPGPDQHDPSLALALMPAARVHREQRPAAGLPAPMAQVSQTVPTHPTAAPLDIDRLDTELWRRFEKRARIENERRGRG
jgi:hypothetical protein